MGYVDGHSQNICFAEESFFDMTSCWLATCFSTVFPDSVFGKW